MLKNMLSQQKYAIFESTFEQRYFYNHVTLFTQNYVGSILWWRDL